MTGQKTRERMVASALFYAEKSSCLIRHGALIAKGKQVYATGYNSAQRCRFLRGHDLCIHAEMAAVTMFINNYVRKKASKFRVKRGGVDKGDALYDLSDFTVWSIKASSTETRTASRPCAMCLYRLKRFGFGKIAYSDGEGIISIHRLLHVRSDHISSAHRCILMDTSTRGTEIRRQIRFPPHVRQILSTKSY